MATGVLISMAASPPVAAPAMVPDGQTAATSPPAGQPADVESAADLAGDVVLDYCCAVRGILNDDQGGPLHPPGLRMAEALQDVRESLLRNLDAKKGGVPRNN
jgi:hypothetical protein